MFTNAPPYWRTGILLGLLVCFHLPAATAATLVVFDFDAPQDDFELQPELLHPALDSAVFSATNGELRDFAGNPGRALAANGFVTGNRVSLLLAAAAGQILKLERVAFDLRVSPSGPQQWRVEIDGQEQAQGPGNGSFVRFQLVPISDPAARTRIDFVGLVASSDQGTLRLDNVLIEGTPQAVGLPPALALLAVPVVTTLRRRRRW